MALIFGETMCCRLIFIVLVTASLLPPSGRTEVRSVLTFSPVHFHQTTSDNLSGWLGLGIGVEINEKWAVNVAWEFYHSVFLTMEPPMFDTVRLVHIFALEATRVFHVQWLNGHYLRTGINAGMGVERTDTYEYAENAVTYYERALSQRFLGSDRKNQPFVGIVVGFAAKTLNSRAWIDYRPKLYGLGGDNAFVHSIGLTIRIPLWQL
ncbi:MAG: hypothetical protein IID63_09025 [candidate division Zixibacteria bacterium]|nr:hypothetical protein [candidate division Zixibacteria bacterium]